MCEDCRFLLTVRYMEGSRRPDEVKNVKTNTSTSFVNSGTFGCNFVTDCKAQNCNNNRCIDFFSSNMDN